MNVRQFTIPYNKIPASQFIEILRPYIQQGSVESVYFGLHGIINNHVDHVRISAEQKLREESNTFEFLEMTKENFPKRMLVINQVAYPLMTIADKEYWIIKQLGPLVDYYNLQGVVIADFEFAKLIRNFFPNLEIQTGINAFHISIENMIRWRDEIGVTVFNPPRATLRQPDILKKIHESGFKIKCIANDLCIVGCPQNCSHAAAVSFGRGFSQGDYERRYCFLTPYGHAHCTDILKCGFILPTWYDFYDQFVDVYKLAGRKVTAEKLEKMLDCYINGNIDYTMKDVLVGEPGYLLDLRNERAPFPHNNFPLKWIPRKLIDCGQKNCETCGVCKALVEKYFKKEGIELTPEVRSRIGEK